MKELVSNFNVNKFDQNENDILSPLIRDVANYVNHDDCQLRGAIVQLLGKAIRGALVSNLS